MNFSAVLKSLAEALEHRGLALMAQMSRRERILLPIALIIPAVVLLAFLAKPLAVSQWGEEIVLQTVPVDPTDLFRGDYADLFYELNQVDLSETEIVGLPEGYSEATLRGQTVYVTFKSADGANQVDQFTTVKPEQNGYLKGVIEYAYPKDASVNSKNLICRISFGIDRYFVEENTGKALEEAARNGQVLVYLKVYRGYGIVENLKLQD